MAIFEDRPTNLIMYIIVRPNDLYVFYLSLVKQNGIISINNKFSGYPKSYNLLKMRMKKQSKQNWCLNGLSGNPHWYDIESQSW